MESQAFNLGLLLGLTSGALAAILLLLGVALWFLRGREEKDDGELVEMMREWRRDAAVPVRRAGS